MNSIISNDFKTCRDEGLGLFSILEDWIIVEILWNHLQVEAEDLRQLQLVSRFFYVLANREFLWKTVVLKKLAKNARLRKSILICEEAEKKKNVKVDEWSIVARPGPHQLKYDRSWKQTYFSTFMESNAKLTCLTFSSLLFVIFFFFI